MKHLYFYASMLHGKMLIFTPGKKYIYITDEVLWNFVSTHSHTTKQTTKKRDHRQNMFLLSCFYPPPPLLFSQGDSEPTKVPEHVLTHGRLRCARGPHPGPVAGRPDRVAGHDPDGPPLRVRRRLSLAVLLGPHERGLHPYPGRGLRGLGHREAVVRRRRRDVGVLRDALEFRSGRDDDRPAVERLGVGVAVASHLRVVVGEVRQLHVAVEEDVGGVVVERQGGDPGTAVRLVTVRA